MYIQKSLLNKSYRICVPRLSHWKQSRHSAANARPTAWPPPWWPSVLPGVQSVSTILPWTLSSLTTRELGGVEMRIQRCLVHVISSCWFNHISRSFLKNDQKIELTGEVMQTCAHRCAWPSATQSLSHCYYWNAPLDSQIFWERSGKYSLLGYSISVGKVSLTSHKLHARAWSQGQYE